MNDLRAIYERREEFQILDVREPYEWQAGRIEGAIHIPLARLMAGGERGVLDPSRPVVVICRSGNRSELAATMLQARGFDASNLEGGMEEWAKEGLPFSAADGGPGRVV
ncbi:MAG TPA: rhodanese-like domain-containing protein [Actinomycetota bacterium]